MKKNDKVQHLRNEPRLRFPEFHDAWNLVKLGDLSNLITKGTTPKKFQVSGINFIKIESFLDNSIFLEKCLYISTDEHENYLKRSKLEVNDILFAIAGATIGKTNIVKEECIPANTNQALSIVRLKNGINHQFILEILKSTKMKKYIYQNISVGAQPNLNLQQMHDFDFYSCSHDEQEKIALYFNLINKKISLLEDKLENLKLFKRGLIQNEFTFTKNREIKLEKLIIEYSKRNRELEVKRVLSVTNSRGFISQDEMFDRSVASSDISTYKIIKKGQFGYNPSRINVGSIDLLTTFDEGVLSPIYVIFYCNRNKLDSQYLKYWFESHNFRENMKKYIEGGVRDTLSFTNLSSMKMPLPSVEEQVKFNKSMNPITHKIEMLENYTITLKQFKKGLLQQMFI